MDVRVVLDHSLRMVAHDLRPRARVVKQYAEVLPVSADETRLGQVFVNLLANASDSIEEGRPVANEVRLRTRTEGSRVIIEIEDTGAGIPPDALERIFDPFFTTKPVGDGPGLGLSVCHGIIKSLGGTIEVRSTVGKGTTFRVSLPAIESTNAGDPITIGAAEPVRRILVVDDEVSILKSVRLIFSRHDVVALADAREALELLRRGEQFDLILCDLMMPNFTGIDLHNALARERPDVADSIVFMTGGVFTGLGRQFLDRIPNERVEKPFEHGALRALLLTLRN
jgi:CheY-like chemotaxis protein/anti-sigma regulatory factor (Ser/Thr protein kinase)